VTRRRQGGTRGRTGSGQKATWLTFDPFFAFLVFVGVGLATLAMRSSPRLVTLWTTLLILWLIYRENKSLKIKYQFREIGRGALIGLAISAPLVVLTVSTLVMAIPRLFVSVPQASPGGVPSAVVFVSLVLLAPLAEELFFRDLLQRERGLWLGAGFYAFFYERLGFVTTLACHVTINLVLLFVPAILGHLGLFTR
jgi:membrane protease YdiL (CAAX protease family)